MHILEVNVNIHECKSCTKVSKGAKIRNRYNQEPYLTQDTNRNPEKGCDPIIGPKVSVYDQGLSIPTGLESQWK